MLPLVRVGAAVSEDVVTSTSLIVILFGTTLRTWHQPVCPQEVVILLRRRSSPFTKRAAWRCTFSTDLMFFSVGGFHTVDAYCTIGLTNVW